MSFYAGVLGEIIIVEFFVLIIWMKVLFESIKTRDASISHKKLLLTSLGLVLNAAAILGAMLIRAYEFYHDLVWLLPYSTIFFVMFGIGNFLFIVSACLGQSTKLLKLFFLSSFVWLTVITVYGNL